MAISHEQWRVICEQELTRAQHDELIAEKNVAIAQQALSDAQRAVDRAAGALQLLDAMDKAAHEVPAPDAPQQPQEPQEPQEPQDGPQMQLEAIQAAGARRGRNNAH